MQRAARRALERDRGAIGLGGQRHCERDGQGNRERAHAGAHAQRPYKRAQLCARKTFLKNAANCDDGEHKHAQPRHLIAPNQHKAGGKARSCAPEF